MSFNLKITLVVLQVRATTTRATILSEVFGKLCKVVSEFVEARSLGLSVLNLTEPNIIH